MQHVLLRVFSHPAKPGSQGMQKLVEVEEGSVYNDNDLFSIPELGGECVIEKRPEEIPDNTDYALHFLARPSAVAALAAEKGWTKISQGCSHCPQK